MHIYGNALYALLVPRINELGLRVQFFYVHVVCDDLYQLVCLFLQEHFDCTSKTSNMYGTIPWSAPEVLRQEKACPESDVW